MEETTDESTKIIVSSNPSSKSSTIKRQQSTSSSNPGGASYPKLGFFKFLESFVLILSMIFMYLSLVPSYDACIVFFWIVFSVSSFIVLILFVLYLCRSYQRLPIMLRSHFSMILLCVLPMVLCMVASIWVLTRWDFVGKIIVSCVFGIIASLLFLLESVYYIIIYTREDQGIELQMCPC